MQRTRASFVVAVVAVAFLATSCAQQINQAADFVDQHPKAVLGTVAGVAAGAGIAALAGGGAGWIVAGALGGGLLGGYVGNVLDDRDKRLAHEAAIRAFEHNRTGQASVWRNPDSGHSGTITPVRTYQLASGQYCREYRQKIDVGNDTHEAYGTACRQPDGSWKIES